MQFRPNNRRRLASTWNRFARVWACIATVRARGRRREPSRTYVSTSSNFATLAFGEMRGRRRCDKTLHGSRTKSTAIQIWCLSSSPPTHPDATTKDALCCMTSPNSTFSESSRTSGAKWIKSQQRTALTKYPSSYSARSLLLSLLTKPVIIPMIKTTDNHEYDV